MAYATAADVKKRWVFGQFPYEDSDVDTLIEDYELRLGLLLPKLTDWIDEGKTDTKMVTLVVASAVRDWLLWAANPNDQETQSLTGAGSRTVIPGSDKRKRPEPTRMELIALTPEGERRADSSISNIQIGDGSNVIDDKIRPSARLLGGKTLYGNYRNPMKRIL